MQATDDPSAFRVPEGTRLLHIGPHKTGTTTIQSAFWAARDAAAKQGVRYAGRSRHPSRAARAVVARPDTYSNDPPPISEWQRLVREMRNAREPRVVASSEFFAWATDDAIQRIAGDLGPDRIRNRGHPPATEQDPAVHVATERAGGDRDGVRPVGGAPAGRPWGRILDPPSSRPADRPMGLDVGADRITAIVVDDGDHRVALSAFEALTGLRRQTLVAVPQAANRSLTLPEAEVLRAFNITYSAEIGDKALYARVVRLGAAQQLKQREPAPDETRISLPNAVVDRVHDISAEIAQRIAQTGIAIVGDVDCLVAPPGTNRTGRASERTGSEPSQSSPSPARVSPAVAAAIAMAVLTSSGLPLPPPASTARALAVESDDPTQAAADLVPTYHIAGVLAIRSWKGGEAWADRRRVGITQRRRRLAAQRRRLVRRGRRLGGRLARAVTRRGRRGTTRSRS